MDTVLVPNDVTGVSRAPIGALRLDSLTSKMSDRPKPTVRLGLRVRGAVIFLRYHYDIRFQAHPVR